MTENQLTPWTAGGGAIIPVNARPAEIAERAQQLSPREAGQIVGALQSGHYEMASTFVWSKAMASLRRQLSTLGMEFIGEMLQRPDISQNSDIAAAITDFEAISLAEDLGMVTSTEAMRLRHAHELVSHFAQIDGASDESAFMTPEEATMCLRTCVQNILGEPRLEVAQDFASFRRQLEEQTFEPSDDKVVALVASPYFYRKTTLSVLLSLLKTAHGAQLEHAVRNTNTFLSALWCELRKPERWQAGQTYAELYAEGKKPAVAGLKESLIRVSGFDYVPENLRSSTFTAAAKAVLDAHEAFNNFYNEPAPMSVLASLGTTIPSPAFPVCMTATLSVRLGNMYGRSTSAQGSAMKILRGLSQARWTYYLNECLPSDRQVLFKLTQEKPMSNWCDLVAEMGLSSDIVTDSLIQKLLEASAARNIHNLRGLTGAILRKQGQAR